MFSYYGSTALAPLAKTTNLDIDKLNFLVCQLFAIAFGRLFCYIFKPGYFSATTRHLVQVVVGFAMTVFCFGIETWILLLQSLVVYCIVSLIPGKNARVIAFVFCLGYLSVAHIYRMYYDYQGYRLDITGPLMIQTQKLSALAYNLFDGQRLNRGESLRSARHVKHAVRHRPSLLAYFSYCFSFHNIMVGPFTFMADYLRFIEGREEEHIELAAEAQTDVIAPPQMTRRPSVGKAMPPAPVPPVPLITANDVVEAVMSTAGLDTAKGVTATRTASTLSENDKMAAVTSMGQLSPEKKAELDASIQRFKHNRDSILAAWWALLRSLLRCVIYGFFMMILMPRFPTSYILSAAYYDENILMRTAWLTICCFFMRTKYYFAWEIGRAANLSAGYGFDGWTTTGKPSYKLVKNFNFFGIECGTSMKAMLDSWNIGTTQWLREVVYDRSPKNLATWLTFSASAFWHGFYPGYYLCFMSAAFFTIVGRVCRRYLRPLFMTQGEKSPIKLVYDVMTAFAGMYVLNYSCIAFTMLSFTEGVQVWKSLYFMGHVGSLAMYFLCPYLGSLTATPRKRD